MGSAEREKLVEDLIASAEKRVAEWKKKGMTREELLEKFAIILGSEIPR